VASAARQRALPQTPERPAAHRRWRPLCASGYKGRQRGEIVRTRPTVLQAHTHQWLGSFGHPGNGQYRAELRRAVAAIERYMQAHEPCPTRTVIRLDGQYGTGAVLSDLAGFSYVMRGKDYQVLEHPLLQARLPLPPDQPFSRPESTLVRTLYDCPDVPVGPKGEHCRVLVATHPANAQKSRVGVTREGVVYELFLTALPQGAFTAAEVVRLYLQRGAFENALSDEDQEQDPDRWCSHSACGQEFWLMLAQWIWNLRLELGQVLKPEPLRTTQFTPHTSDPQKQATCAAASSPGYRSPERALPFKQGRFSGRDFVPQPDGTLHCPAGQRLSATERRREADGSLRLVYAARISQCRLCSLPEPCQWHGEATKKPRRVSVLLHPLQVEVAPWLWRDWSRRAHRGAWIQLLRSQRVEVILPQALPASPPRSQVILSRPQRAHFRLSWAERLACHARAPNEGLVTIKLFGLPEAFATFLGLPTS
jgi:hypothetical protein